MRTHVKFPLYFVDGSVEARGVYIGDLDGTAPRRLLDADTAATYVSGHLLFVRQGVLVAQALDPSTLTLARDPFPVAEQIAYDPMRYTAAASASSDGTLVYRAGSVAGRRQFAWFDRTGHANESGRFDIYVRPFGRPGDTTTISRNGGAQVRWRANGKELFYVAFANRLIAVPIQLAPDGGTIEIGTPVPLFSTRIGGAVQGPNRQQYMVSSDGQRFLMNTLVEGNSSPIVVRLNWKAARLGPGDASAK